MKVMGKAVQVQASADALKQLKSHCRVSTTAIERSTDS